MSILFLILAAFVPAFNFFLPRSRHFYLTIFSQLIIALYAVSVVLSTWLGAGEVNLLLLGEPATWGLKADALSGLFVLLINLVCLLTSIYSKGYLAPYLSGKTGAELALHSLALVWLQVSMIFVVLFRDGFHFLAAWEVMTLVSFILVMFEAEKRETFWVGLSYLIQMHVGFFFILAGFVLAYNETGIFGFSALPLYFSKVSNIPLFLLFLVGFGLKAGFVPLHTWLPNAHPAAPSHVSGAMSGIMIKMGIYGLIRVMFSLQQQYLEVGLILLGISVLTGLWGVISAILQKDIKKVLAYSSIENIGIIGMGLGLGFIGLYLQSKTMALFAFTGAILHIVNHSLFKPLLFMGAGSIYKATHTRNADELGGLIKKMPQTSLLFIAGSMAICALPPFNGFISEFLIYIGMFDGLLGQSLREIIVLISSTLVLALIGGLAIFAFSKTVGVALLGTPRKSISHVIEVDRWMLLPQYLLVVLMLLVGVFPASAVKLVISVVALFPKVDASVYAIVPMLSSTGMISIMVLAFIGFIVVILFVRSKVQQDAVITEGPTWGCGYTAVDAKQQYTSTSHADSIMAISKPLVKVTKEFDSLAKTEFFPHDGSFKTGSNDLFEDLVTARPTNRLTKLLKKAAILQTGLIQHYVLYAMLFIFGILVLTYFNLI